MSEAIKVLIVDDEEIVRRGFRYIIDWEALGCTICGEATNGKEALEKINSLYPSIVLLDINMPVMSGVDVLAEVHNNPKLYPSHPKFLILSGYSDFDYAHKAINYGAKGYIVKPVDEDILEGKIADIVRDIRSENEAVSLKNTAKSKTLEKKFNQMFLFGAVDDAFLPDEETEDTFQTAILSPSLCGCDGQLQALKIAVDDAFKQCRHIAFSMEPEYVVVFKNESQETIEKYLYKLCAFLQKAGSIASLGQAGKGLQGALDSFFTARDLYKKLFFFKDTAFVCKENAEKLFTAKSPADLENAKAKNFFNSITPLVQHIEIYDLQTIGTIIQDRKEWLIKSNMPIDEIKKLCMAFIVETNNAIRKKYPEKEFDTVQALDLVNLIYSQNYFDDMMEIVKDFTMGLAESFASSTSNSTILKVVHYVKTNYNTDLKLEMLGNLFNCNSAYLGKKFKEYTGVSFNTYMDIIRIEKAKKMILETDLKIHEISKLVGYSNTDYFYLKFKKHTSMTPKEFKSSNGI